MQKTILVIDDEAPLLESLRLILGKSGYDVRAAATGIEGVAILKKELGTISVLITDLALPGGFDGINVLEAARELDSDLPVIVITAYGSVDIAVTAMQKGAFTFLTKPVSHKVLLQQLEKAYEAFQLRTENKRLRREIDSINEDKYRIVHDSNRMKMLLEDASRVAKTDETVLITGESGTGKELVARHILAKSRRANKNFVAFNAAAVNENLMESELFGFVKGAFTGADRTAPGYIGAAEGGTLFIDEIGEMPLPLQSKMLRFLQEKEYFQVGSPVPQKADVRIIAATNKNLERESMQGRFREDLYYRLARFPLAIPPLRERPDDIPVLLRFFIERLSKQYGMPPVKPPEALIRKLSEREWRGNVRELEHYAARFVLSAGREETSSEAHREHAEGDILSFRIGEKTMKEMEKELINATLRSTGGNKAMTAKLLDISERTIYRRITGDEEL